MDEDQRRAMIFAGRKRVLLTVGLPLMAVIVIFLLFGMWRLGVNNAQKAAEVVELANIQPATEITLEELLSIPDPDIKITESNQVVINGSLRANKAFIVSPSLQPEAPESGELYFDSGDQLFRYYDGERFTTIASQDPDKVVCYVGADCGFLRVEDLPEGLTLPQPLGTTDSPTFAAITLTNDLRVTQGGTGRSSFNANSVILGNGSNALTSTSSPVAGQMLVTNTVGTPTFVSVTGDVAITTAGLTSLSNNSVGANELVTTGVLAGVYGDSTNYPTFTVDADGRIISVSTEVSVVAGSVTALNTLTGGLTLQGTANQVTVSDNGSDTITLSLPQDINTTSAPTFATVDTGSGAMEVNTIAAYLGNQDLETTDAVTFNSLTLTTDLTVANGGTGVSSFTSHGLVYGNAAGALQVTAAGATGQCLLGTTGSAPTWGACPADGVGISSLGGLTGATQTFANGTNVTISSVGTTHTLGWTGQLAVASGGTGVGTLTNGGILLGSGTGAVTATAVLTNGQLLIGDGTGAPTVGTLTGGNAITVTNGAGSISIAVTALSIGDAEIVQDSIDASKLAPNSVDSSELIDGSVDESHLAVSNTPTNGRVLTANGTGFTWVDPGGLGTSKWTDLGVYTYLTNTTDALSVGGNTDLGGKLQVVGTADEVQLRIRANATQTVATSPLILAETSTGTELFRLHATDSSSIFLGYQAGYADDGTTNSNTALGSSSLYFNTTGYNNTAQGFQSLYSNTTGYENTALGSSSLYSNTTGRYNTAQGSSSLYSNTTGYLNTAQGFQSLYSNTTGRDNTAQGFQSLYSNTTGSSNTALGSSSLYANTTGRDNTAQGFESLYANTTGYNNTAQGYRSLYLNTTGYENTAQGFESLYANTTGRYNTAQGSSSLYSNTTGWYNTAQGLQSLYSNTTGRDNTAQGYQSLSLHTNGHENTAVGVYTGSF